MRGVGKVVLVLVLWLGLSGLWFVGVVWAQSATLEEAKRLYDQAEQLHRQGKYAEAVPFAQKAFNIREKALGPEHQDVIRNLHNLVLLYRKMGNYAAAEPLLKRYLMIREKKLGPEHPNLAITLGNLASLYRDMGNYAAAEPLYKRSLAIDEKALGPEHRDVVRSLHNLASLYRDMGNYATAEPLLKRYLMIREKKLGSEHPVVAEDLHNLASLYYAMGNYAPAEPLYKRSLMIREKALGPEHPDVTIILSNLAELYRAMGNNAAAESLSKRILEKEKKAPMATKTNEDLISASEKGDLAAVKDLLFRGADVNARAKDGSTSLMWVALEGNADVVRLLIEKGADVNAKTKGGFTALIGAAGGGFADIVQLLINKGSDVNAKTKEASTALMEAAGGGFADIVQLLINKGSDVNARDDYDKTALIMSADKGHIDVVRLLIEKGADVNAKENLSGRTALIIAADRGETKLVRLLIENSADINAKDKLGWTALTLAQLNKKAEVIELLASAPGIKFDKLASLKEKKRLGALIENLSKQGKYQEAVPLGLRSLEIMEKAFGPEDEFTTESIDNLAKLYVGMGDYTRAEPLCKRVLANQEKKYGKDHPATGLTLFRLGELYKAMGDNARAEPLYLRGLALMEKNQYTGDKRFIAIEELNYRTQQLLTQGKYDEAIRLAMEALSLTEKALGAYHPDTALSLSNLAVNYMSIGDYGKAEPLLKRALDIYEKVREPDYLNTASVIDKLAMVYASKDDNANAETHYKRALELREKAVGRMHPETATSLNNLASHYFYVGAQVKAESLFKRALEILEKSKGPDHPDTAASLNNLATLYMNLGDYAKVEPLLIRALEIQEKVPGINHRAIAISLNNLAVLLSAKGNFLDAQALLKREQTIDTKIIDQVMGFTTEDQKMKFLAPLKVGIDLYLCLTTQHLINNPQARQDSLDAWLRRKGVVLEAQRGFQEALVHSDDAEARQVFQQLAEVRAQISQLMFAGPGKERFDVYQKKLKELNGWRDELEAKLSRMSQVYAQARKARKVTVEEVARALPQGTVLVDFARTNFFDFKAKGRWLPAHYLAFVLRSGQGQDVALIDLGPAEEIDRSLNQLKNALTQQQQAKGLDLSRRLHDLVFAPLQKELGEARRVFLSPDGALNLLPFEILRDPEGKYLIEKYTFNYLGAGRDLVSFSKSKKSDVKPLLLGDPDFDLDPKQKSQALNRLGMRADTAVASVRSPEQRSLRFKRLDGTRKEVNAISDLLGKGQCEVFLDSSALEEVLQSHKAPRILHLATHGFFLKDQDLSTLQAFRGVGGTDSFMSIEKPVALPSGPRVKLENPLLRSGIALAGANRAGSTAQGSDGILTADEVLGLRLWGTELVVLSACETGLGEVKTGEGVFGLRRAFIQAGARSLVMSMWSVPDEPTKDLMVEFYRNILSGKLDRCQALRQAVLKMKQKYGDNPYYWGAFVFLGQAD